MYVLMNSIYPLCFQYVILFFTYLLGFPSWFIMAAKYLNVYICPTLPCYNFTLWFLSSWVLIIVLCTMCQTYVTQNASWQSSIDTDFVKIVKVMSFVHKLRMGIAA